MLRKNYQALIKHENYLKDDLQKLNNVVKKYEVDHTHLSGFHEGDLVDLDKDSAKFIDQQFPDFAGSTGSFIKNISVAFMFFKEPDVNDDIISIITQENDKKIQLNLLPNSINLLIKNIELFQIKVTDTLTRELCERILPKLQSFEAEVISFREESNKIEESKNTESNPISIQDQKKTVSGNLQNQKNPSVALDFSATLFAKNNGTGSKTIIHNNKPIKPEEEHKQITPPKSPTNK